MQGRIMISKTPEDPEAKSEWVDSMKRLQYSLWMNAGHCCMDCGLKPKTTEEFMEKLTHFSMKAYVEKQFDPLEFVCEDCWEEHKKRYNAR